MTTYFDIYEKGFKNLRDSYDRFIVAFQATDAVDTTVDARCQAMQECQQIVEDMEGLEATFSTLHNQYLQGCNYSRAASRLTKARDEELITKEQAYQAASSRYKSNALAWAKRIYDEATYAAANYRALDKWRNTIDKCSIIASQYYVDVRPSPTVQEVHQAKLLWESIAASVPTWQSWQRRRYAVGSTTWPDAFVRAGNISDPGEASHWWIDADTSIERTDI